MADTDSTNKIVQLIPEEEKQDDPFSFTTSAGITFKLRKVPPFLMIDAQRKFIAPKPPMVYIEDKETHEENPNDPEYLAALQKHQRDLSDLGNAIMLARGTMLVSKPDSIPGPDDADWSAELEELAGEGVFDIPKVGKRRYYAWLKYVALTDMSDFQGITNKLTATAGITTEAEVAKATDDFRSDEGRDTSDGVPAGEGSTNGDTGAIPVPGTSS